MIRLQFDNTYTIPLERIQISHCRSAEALMEHIQRNRDWLTQQKGIEVKDLTNYSEHKYYQKRGIDAQ